MYQQSIGVARIAIGHWKFRRSADPGGSGDRGGRRFRPVKQQAGQASASPHRAPLIRRQVEWWVISWQSSGSATGLGVIQDAQGKQWCERASRLSTIPPVADTLARPAQPPGDLSEGRSSHIGHRPSTFVPAAVGDTPPSSQPTGIRRRWPTRIRLGLLSWFRVARALTVVPYRAAIEVSVSP